MIFLAWAVLGWFFVGLIVVTSLKSYVDQNLWPDYEASVPDPMGPGTFVLMMTVIWPVTLAFFIREDA